MTFSSEFSPALQAKIELLKNRRKSIKLGQISFAGPLLLAPMSAICISPFRLMMEELGAGGTVSELVSCHGINYKNQKTTRMLYVDPREQNVGIQLFGEDPESMAKAAVIAQESNPKFIDINMGCPVRKVVTKGGGSALLKDTSKLANFFNQMKKALELPLTIKIRTGWDEDSINALEIANIAYNEGVEFVAVHGRTRTQQYKGLANWDLLEKIAEESPLPIIGNGDLHSTPLVSRRMKKTNCDALMLARGPLRNPFLFLEPYIQEGEDINFSASDYFEVVNRYVGLLSKYTDRERVLLIQIRKLVVWYAHGFPQVAKFRGKVFETPTLEDTLKLSEDYFMTLEQSGEGVKQLDFEKPFMAGGHG